MNSARRWSYPLAAQGALLPMAVLPPAAAQAAAGNAKAMARGFGAEQGGTTGQLLMHEIGHAVGLGHPAIDDPTEIMYPMLTTKKAVWGAGDLVGLRKVGRSAACLYARSPAQR